MIRKPSVFTRLARAVTALSTVWSLGCCGFEPLVGQLLAAETGAMTDCAESSASAPDGASLEATVTASPSVASTSAAVHATQDASCGCGNCQAPSPPVAVAAVGRPPTPVAQAAVEMLTPGIFRTPLVPPPQRA